MSMFLANAFSLQMLSNFPTKIEIQELTNEEFSEILSAVNSGTVTSAIGHADTANVLRVPCNRINVSLNKGDILYVAQLQGGRLPEGSTTLPEGFSFKFLAVMLL